MSVPPLAADREPGCIVTEITEFRKLGGGILSKIISLGDDGRPRADGSPCRLTFGMARRHRMNGRDPAGALASFLDGMSSDRALSLGCITAEVVEQECRVVSTRRLPEFEGLPAITRTLDNFGWSTGPGWVLVDFDAKGMPPAVRAKLDVLGGQEGALRSLVPGFGDAAWVARRSTSSGLHHAETGEAFTGSGGRHDYLLLADQSDARRFLEALHRRAWLAGLGWLLVGAAGQTLERSIIDVSVGSPERLVFEGAPNVAPPLVQDAASRRAAPSSATAPLNSLAAVPDLSAAEEATYRRLVQAERERLKPEAATEQKKWLAREGAKLGPHGERILKGALAKRTLCGTMTLEFDDEELGRVTVDEVMADPTRFAGETLADPLDGVEYGTGKAKLFINEDGAVAINSFAHGGRTFRLLHSAASARVVLEKAGDEAAKLYIKVMLAADLNAAEEDELLNLVRNLTGTGKRPLKADLKRAKGEAARERARERVERGGGGVRITKRAPLPDEERSPVVSDLEAILSEERPPTLFQNVMGEIVRVARHRSGLLHLLTSETAAGGAHSDLFAPAPETPLIVPHSPDSLREVVERRVRYLLDTDEGPPRVVSLPEVFLRAFLTPRESCTLPLLTAISAVAVVTPNGNVIIAGGYHPPSGIYFTRSETEARAMVPDDVGPDAVAAAYRFLAGELFVDAALCDRNDGVAALVAFLLTVMAQAILPEKPVFCINAPQRGSGKTTLVNIVVRAVTGRSAAAAAWSLNEEERRKSFFAAAREGREALPIDNVPRGTVIRDATIERFSTSAEVRDRVLGESRTEAVRSPVIIITGNALQMGGDSGSRTLMIDLTAERPDPENRPFRHPDILGWVDRNRTAILRAALTIALGNPTLRDPDAIISTRFKAWQVLVGSAVEHAAGLAGMPASMVDIIRKAEAGDDTIGGLVELLELLKQAFPGSPPAFTIEDLTTRLLNPNPLDHEALNNQLLDAIRGLSRAPLREVTARTVGTILQRNVKGVPIDDGNGGIWVIRPQPRANNRERVKWEVVRRVGGAEQAASRGRF